MFGRQETGVEDGGEAFDGAGAAPVLAAGECGELIGRVAGPAVSGRGRGSQT
ncbi:hypothetical protein GCM10010282_72890 [Streptomyces roseolus]|nr:hypothetical protein GCM10010282_72890 [Streptomyces roseolus]